MDRTSKRQAATKIEYKSLLDRCIAAHPAQQGSLGRIPLRELTAGAVRVWFASLGNQHVRRNSHAYGLLHAVCATAVKDGLLPANPCQITRAMNPPRKREPIILTVAEVGALADAIEERFKALFLISAWCGLRWGEVTELRRKDVGAGCEIISVSRAVTHRGSCRIDSTKSGHARTVVVPPHIRADIKDHLDNHTADSADALLFPPLRGGCHLNDSVFMRSSFRPALKAIGREGVRVHDLRHFAGTMTTRVGNLVETMERLGHSTAKASLIYQQSVNGRRLSRSSWNLRWRSLT